MCRPARLLSFFFTWNKNSKKKIIYISSEVVLASPIQWDTFLEAVRERERMRQEKSEEKK